MKLTSSFHQVILRNTLLKLYWRVPLSSFFPPFICSYDTSRRTYYIPFYSLVIKHMWSFFFILCNYVGYSRLFFSLCPPFPLPFLVFLILVSPYFIRCVSNQISFSMFSQYSSKLKLFQVELKEYFQ